MTEIFVSYKREDRARVRPIVLALRSRGFEVWWDMGLLPSASFAKDIANVIDRSKIALTLWTKDAVKSDWVLAEAEKARTQDKYFGVYLDRNVELPLPFNTLQAADLTGRSEPGEELDWLCAAIENKLGPRPILNTDVEGKRAAASDAEAAIWFKARTDDTVKSYKIYLELYEHNGVFVEEAHTRIQELSTFRSRLEYGSRRALAATAFSIGLLAGSATIAGTYWQNFDPKIDASKYAKAITDAKRIKSDLLASETSRNKLDKLLVEFEKRELRYVESIDASLQHQEKLEAELLAAISAADLSEQKLASLETSKASADERIAELEEHLETTQSQRDRYRTALNLQFSQDEQPASTRWRWECDLPEATSSGISFAGKCWSRSTETIELNGFGLDAATDLTPVAELENLVWLEVSKAKILDLSPLRALPQLQVLNIQGTPVNDLTPLKEMYKLHTFCPPTGNCIINNRRAVQRFLDLRAR